MKTQPRFVLLAALALAAPACATSSAAPSPASGTSIPTAAPGRTAAPTAKRAPRRNASLISTEEIRAATQNDALALVQALRPQWIRPRGQSSMSRPEYVQVYQDGTPMGGPGALRQISTRAITSIRFLDGITATQRFGTDHGSGAILITTGG